MGSVAHASTSASSTGRLSPKRSRHLLTILTGCLDKWWPTRRWPTLRPSSSSAERCSTGPSTLFRLGLACCELPQLTAVFGQHGPSCDEEPGS